MLLDQIRHEDFRGRRVVDLGTGEGRLAFVVADLGGRVIGVDLDRVKLMHARAYAGIRDFRNVEFVLGDVEKTPYHEFARDPIDAVVSNLCMSPEIVWHSSRALRPGGAFIFCAHHGDHWKETRRGSRWAFYEDSMRDLLEENRFQVEFLGVDTIAVAPVRGRSVGCETIQIFSRSPRMLRKTKPIPPEEAKAFQDNMAKGGLFRAVIHANYLINLSSSTKNGLRYSRVAFVEELDRAQVLGIRDVIFHPGAHMGKGEGRALKTIAESLDWAFDHAVAPDVAAVLENTAGQGTVVGHSFAQLAEIIKGSSHPERLAVCIDTCHTFAAGYDFRTPEGYEALLRNVDETVGLSRVRAFHLNDSKGELACHADRHEDIGKGKLGKDPFRFLVNDERFRDIPGILEFPGTDGGYRRELKLLRSFVTGPNPPTSHERQLG